MTPRVSISMLPCPDPMCIDVTILVHNAYSEDPLKPEEEVCRVCHGKSYIVSDSITRKALQKALTEGHFPTKKD